MTCYTYILLCDNGKYYTGSTHDLEGRHKDHLNGFGANFTRKHKPVKLVYFEEYDRIDEAYYREKQIQGWNRKKKEALINNTPEILNELSKCKNETKATLQPSTRIFPHPEQQSKGHSNNEITNIASTTAQPAIVNPTKNTSKKQSESTIKSIPQTSTPPHPERQSKGRSNNEITINTNAALLRLTLSTSTTQPAIVITSLDKH